MTIIRAGGILKREQPTSLHVIERRQKTCETSLSGADGAFRWREAEAALAAAFVAEGLRGVRLSSDGFVEDLFADAAYRGHLAAVLARRAVALANALGSGVEVFSHGSPLRRG